MANPIFTTNVLDYGAVGNGVADDTAAITRALAAAPAGSTVLFPAGRTFKTTSQITVPSDGLTLSGYGAVITSATESQFRKFRFSGRARGAVLGLRFECLYSAASTGLSEACVEISNSTDITVRDCEFNEVAKNGVYIDGTSTRCVVDTNRFYRCFCAIFVDDDTTNQPTKLSITNNIIRSGLSTASFSGAIKISGLPGAVNHVIEGNIIDGAGEMGIEAQGPDNFAVSNNSVTNTSFGISISNCKRVTVAANDVSYCSSYGIEVASASSFVTVAGNAITQTGSSTRGIIVVNGSKNISICGNNVVSSVSASDAIYIQGRDVAVNGNSISGLGGINCHNASNISIVGNTMQGAYGGGFGALGIDATDSPVTGILFSENRIVGGYPNCGVFLYSPNGRTISDVQICHNNTQGCDFAAGGFNFTTATGVHFRIHVLDNFSWSDYDYNKGLNTYHATLTTGMIWPNGNSSVWGGYPWLYWERGVVDVNASSNALGIMLPDARNMGMGWQTTFAKSDSSSNTVFLSGYAEQTLNGVNIQTIGRQYGRMTVMSNGSNWLITHSG